MNKKLLIFCFGITLAAFLIITGLSIWEKNLYEEQIELLSNLVSNNYLRKTPLLDQSSQNDLFRGKDSKTLHLKEKNIQIDIPSDWEEVRPFIFAYPPDAFENTSEPIPYYFKEISFPKTPVEYKGNLEQWVESVMKQYQQNGQNSPYTNYNSKQHIYIGMYYRYEVINITAKQKDKVFEDYFVKHPLKNQAVQITIVTSEIQYPDVIFDAILSTFKFTDENIEIETEYAYIDNIYQQNNKYYLKARYLNWFKKNGNSDVNCIKNHSCIISISKQNIAEEIHDSASGSLNGRYKTIQEISKDFSTKTIYEIIRQNGKIVGIYQIGEV